MSVTLTYAATGTVAEVIENNDISFSNTANKTVTHSALNQSGTLTGATTPPVTKVAIFNQALTGGAATIDLTAVPGTNGATTALNGLKVQYLFVKANAENANPITLTEGASTGYELAGNGWTVVLQPGQWFTFFGNDATPDVDSGAKTIDLSGTGSQSVDIEIVAG